MGLPKALPGPAVDFTRLWFNLRALAAAAGQERFVAVLNNHERNPEQILRKLGVVSDADVSRVVSGMGVRK